jgi:hypothetical protein
MSVPESPEAAYSYDAGVAGSDTTVYTNTVFYTAVF